MFPSMFYGGQVIITLLFCVVVFFPKATGELHSVERTLEKYLPESELKAVKQVRR